MSVTNKLNTVTGQTAIAYGYDANGNVSAIGDKTFIYDQNNRLIETREAGSVKGQYAYNGLGQRAVKIAGGKTTLFIYDKDGNLIAEADETGKIQTEYVYLDGQKLAKFAVNPGEDNLRFPGQYFDEETGLHYNMNRYYDPDTGRYLTPDPIGLAGGINLYSYVQNNPVNLVDQFGLASNDLTPWDDFDNILEGGGAGRGVGGGGYGRSGKSPFSKQSECQEAAKAFSKEKQALVDMAKADKKGGITSADMEAYKQLNKGLLDPFPTNKIRGPEMHLNRGENSQQPHGHVGPVNHIPIRNLQP